jgi:hypothetical protein
MESVKVFKGNEIFQKQFEEFLPRKFVRITLDNGESKNGHKFKIGEQIE